jgi:hypothetical protein
VLGVPGRRVGVRKQSPTGADGKLVELGQPMSSLAVELEGITRLHLVLRPGVSIHQASLQHPGELGAGMPAVGEDLVRAGESEGPSAPSVFAGPGIDPSNG